MQVGVELLAQRARICLTPCFSSTFSSSRSVSSTPSSSALTPPSAFSRSSAFSAAAPRAMLSATARMSRAKIGDAVDARIGDLALGPPAQIFHLGERAQQPVLVVGGLLAQRPRPAPRSWLPPARSPRSLGRHRRRCARVVSVIALVRTDDLIRPGYQGSGVKNQADIAPTRRRRPQVSRRSACSPPWRCSPPSG